MCLTPARGSSGPSPRGCSRPSYYCYYSYSYSYYYYYYYYYYSYYYSYYYYYYYYYFYCYFYVYYYYCLFSNVCCGEALFLYTSMISAGLGTTITSFETFAILMYIYIYIYICTHLSLYLSIYLSMCIYIYTHTAFRAHGVARLGASGFPSGIIRQTWNDTEKI